LDCGSELIEEEVEMNFSEQVKDLTGQQVSKMIVELLRRVSDERLVQERN
jgi:hypothetical protein